MKLINIENRTDIIVENKVKTFLNPDYIYLPIAENFSFKLNTKVLKNTIIDPNSRNILSSVSGKIIAVRKMQLNNKPMNFLEIENNFKEEKDKNIRFRYSDFNLDTLKVLINEASDKRLIEIFNNISQVDNIIINVIQDEPYCKNKIMLFKEYLHESLEMYDKLKDLFRTKNNLIVFKNTDSEIIEECLNVIGTYPELKIHFADHHPI